jgi:hypothetical protein
MLPLSLVLSSLDISPSDVLLHASQMRFQRFVGFFIKTFLARGNYLFSGTLFPCHTYQTVESSSDGTFTSANRDKLQPPTLLDWNFKFFTLLDPRLI